MRMFGKLILFAAALSMSGIYLPEASAAGACAQKIIGKCQANGRDAGGTDGTAGSNLFGNATTGSTEAGAASRRMAGAAKGCRDMKKECAKCPQAERKQCEEGLEGSAGQMDAQSAGMGDASALMGMAAAMAAAAMQMAKKDKEEEEQQQNQSAFLGNGQYDCTKPDAMQFQACDAILAKSCRNAMEDWRCPMFANAYCGSARGANDRSFCGFVQAYNFCRPGNANDCPSCKELQKQTSQICAANPAACIGQNSPDVIAATTPLHCATTNGGDPMLRDPAIIAALGQGAGYVNPGTGGGAPPGNGGLAPPVIPGGGAPGGGGPPAGGGGIPVVNPNPGAGGGGVPVAGGPPVPPPVGNGGGGGVGIAGAGIRDGNAPAGQAGGINASAGGGGVAAGTVISIASVGGGGGIREGQPGRQVANAGGPAPDVQGQYGPSVFSMGTQAIRNKCAAGKFMHCP